MTDIYTYDYAHVKKETSIWVIKTSDVEKIATDICPANGIIHIKMPIGDYLCKMFTKRYKSPRRNPYKAQNHIPGKFDVLPILLPRILGIEAEALKDRFSEQLYNRILPETYKPPNPKNQADSPVHADDDTIAKALFFAEEALFFAREAAPFTHKAEAFTRKAASFSANISSFVRESETFGDESESFLYEVEAFTHETLSSTDEAESFAREAASFINKVESFAREAASFARETLSSVDKASPFADKAEVFVNKAEAFSHGAGVPEENPSQKTEDEPELAQIREKLQHSDAEASVPNYAQEMSLLDPLNEVIPQMLIDGIIAADPVAIASKEFKIQREEFWETLTGVLSSLYSKRFDPKADSASIATYIEESTAIPTLLPIGGYYEILSPVIKSFIRRGQKTTPLEDDSQIPDSSRSHEDEVAARQIEEIFKTFFPCLVKFFTADADASYIGNTNNRAAQKNAWIRAPQNIFILLRRYSGNDLTKLNLSTGKPAGAGIISTEKDFNALKNLADRFLNSQMNETNAKMAKYLFNFDAKLIRAERQRNTPRKRQSQSMVDNNPLYGKSRAIYELLAPALEKKKDTTATTKANTQLQNAKTWQLRDFCIIVQKWVESLDPKTVLILQNATQELQKQIESHEILQKQIRSLDPKTETYDEHYNKLLRKSALKGPQIREDLYLRIFQLLFQKKEQAKYKKKILKFGTTKDFEVFLRKILEIEEGANNTD